MKVTASRLQRKKAQAEPMAAEMGISSANHLRAMTIWARQVVSVRRANAEVSVCGVGIILLVRVGIISPVTGAVSRRSAERQKSIALWANEKAARAVVKEVCLR